MTKSDLTILKLFPILCLAVLAIFYIFSPKGKVHADENVNVAPYEIGKISYEDHHRPLVFYRMVSGGCEVFTVVGTDGVAMVRGKGCDK